MAHLPAYTTTMTELHALRDAYRRDKAALLAAMQSTGASARGIRALLRKLSTLAGDLLQTLWQRARLPDEMALVAVGGFGRGQLFPCSDVDVLLLLPDAVVPELRSRLEGFIGSCWDAGLEIGSSVRTVAECLAESAGDVTVQTSLLESRLLCGSAALFGQFQHQYRAQMNPAAFVLAKTLEMRQRHTKYENTPYALEPNCKESPGGLRDLQMILWVAQAAGLGSHWKALAANGIATAFELRQIEHNEALLCLIRARLHAAAGRREDRLVFDLQTAVAESFGYRSQAPDGTRLPMRASETLMRRYYWAAKAVSQLNQILLLNIEERLSPSTHAPRPLNARFFEKAGRIEVAGDDLYTRDPHAILETFLLYQTTPGLGDLSARTLRALYNARSVMDSAFRRDPVNRSAFMRILQQPSGITHAMRLMNQTSVLGRYLWPFRRIVGQMQHDLFHVYTVDQHILMVLRNVRRFFIAEHAHEYPFCSQLAGDWDKPWVLYVAALFHDIGKGRGGDHSQIGAAEVRRFCHQHGVHRDDARRIEFLVREHLTMSTVAQKQDLSDPDVIAAFAHRMGDERNLTALYLLTVADIRGTSPKVWNAWKGKLLEDLYRATLRALGGRVPDAATEIEARKREALVLLALDAQPFDAHKALWATLGVSYFMRHDAADIAWHARHLSRHVGAAKPVVRARPSLAGDGLQAMVYTADQADLFARICSYFDRAGFSILDARVHTASNGYALDTFQVVASSQPGHYRELTQMVESDLTRLIEAGGPLSEPARKRVSRRVKSFPVAPRVGLQPDEKAQRWLLTISASDRAGLLYLVARVLAQHRLSVQLAKVSTLGERVEDSFLIQGPELQNNARRIQIETELLRALSDEESVHEPSAAGGA
ncbi:[protein-PII] uridylyltransferase [Verminephrobacter aporrectodeae]|uniref:[protein-PII] uridylyltransferase n=1 Tax=Verminephrobacter aporrectodeae TaxID=1110389 RepID=UPI0022436CDD|nr:[protein-PII] uridylyltransferase [Verminephrobacter aporrectodeae]MCW8175225.1 [protein-PII] uridylyltransferase [Verminephrobacter aporrectodeae subsp. tuberculatae]MCW8202674.1 [protein-PII] uridylyltransferase [Verminephrobacter aporrectodeae subsp. tuberculatae]